MCLSGELNSLIQVIFYLTLLLMVLYTCRSKDFHSIYGNIHEIGALVPQGVPFMAFTASLTKV